MRFSVPHNWQDDLIEALDLSRVDEFYGKLDSDIVGGGRPSNMCPPVSRETVAKQVKKVRSRGIQFTYLLNTVCLDNRELSHTMHRKISELLDWLGDLGVDSVTVSMPYLSEFVRRKYPRFKISVSAMAQVDSPEKAKFWEDLGASKITLSNVKVNRDFGLIKKIRGSVTCKLQLIANNGCLYNCPYAIHHSLLPSHASQKGHVSRGFVIDYYRTMCTYLRLKDPTHFIRADWIRPEDLRYYDGLGIDSVKLTDRGMTTFALKTIVKAYSAGTYDGNLMDLLPSASKNINFSRRFSVPMLKYFFRPRLVNIFKLAKKRKALNECGVWIDNKALEGFLLSVQEKKCDSTMCEQCMLCKDVASRVVKIDPAIQNAELAKIGDFLGELESGCLFEYGR